MMSNFSNVALLGCLATMGSAYISPQQPNTAFDNGTIRMGANHVRSEKGGLADVLADTRFKLDDGNQSYLFMDTSAMYQEESESYK